MHCKPNHEYYSTFMRNSAIHLLPFLIMSYSAASNSMSPLIVLDQYEGSGIRLVCKSENVRSPELLQLSWMDGKGQELSATPTTLGKSSIENSVLLESGSGSAVSCRITNKSSNTPMGSTSLVIADIFFPSTSLCMVGFFIIAVLIINVIIFTYLKLNHDRWKIAFSENETLALEEEKAQLQRKLEKVKEETGKEFRKVQDKFAKAEHELEFRRALSCAVDVTLDPKCTHAKLTIKEKNKVKYNHSSLEQPKDPKGALIAVANEGYSKGEMYWEVEVGHKCEWELGVLTITARNRLEEEMLEKPLEEEYIGMRWFQGKFHCTGGNSLIDGQNEECEVVGVFLDMNKQALSFYNVQKMCPILSIPYGFSEEMYPFFNPGSDDRFLEVRPISIPKCLISV
ncbi:butyrophilin subfamily 2 member A1-like isoform X2 [Zootoca vivipara]|uniref:butyrophilin subfamily 2 member A1-like isoform X2 n=1 Tax=Zootoca vivipara TaxID=8524 RepID=UPI0015909078|nr:butyrophilin subfamily 2 member A1-like isoform X2 [Zootoca vivipara]XP_034991918.1 butyrophilin subfamily 2 member A1-like isoform X2 [Zootoca vivipara]